MYAIVGFFVPCVRGCGKELTAVLKEGSVSAVLAAVGSLHTFLLCVFPVSWARTDVSQCERA